MQPEDHRLRLKERERGVLSQQIFANPLWDEAYTTLVNQQMERMLAASVSPDETLECKRQILALYSVKRALETVMQTGKLAEQQIEEAKKDG